MSLRKHIYSLIEKYDIGKIKSIVDSIYSKYAKNESYYEQVKDFIFKVSYNYLKKNNENIPVSRVIYYLEKFKGIDMSNPALKIHYENLVRKIRKKAYDRLRYERQIFIEKENEFLQKILDYNRRGFISKSVCNSLLEYFFSYTLADIEDTGKEESLSVAVIDILSIGANLYPEKSLYINLLANHLQEEYVTDEEFLLLMSSLKDFALKYF